MKIVILSEKQLDIIEEHSNNTTIRYVTLCLTLLGCLSQLYHHTRDYADKDVLRELSRIPVEKFDLPDQTFCFQFVYLINLNKIRKLKPIILEETEKYFKIKLDESIYFKLIQNDSFKEYFIRKLDQHTTYAEFHDMLIKRSQIFERIEIALNDKLGYLQIYQINQHCMIKQLIRTFYSCYTFTCSSKPFNNEFDNKTQIKDVSITGYFLDKFKKYRIQQRYLLSYLGKNIVSKIHLKKQTFVKNGLKNFIMQLHEANSYPRRLESLIYVQEINPDGFRQLYTYTFLHVKRLSAPFKSNCTEKIEFINARYCEDYMTKKHFNSLLFGNYYSRNKSYDDLTLGLNSQYFYYKFNRKTLQKIIKNCSIKTSMDQCDEYIYYIYSNLALPTDRMILQLMVPINANYLCEDRAKLELSEYLLKSLSIINFWFGFTIIQALFNFHDDIGTLYKKTMKVNSRIQTNLNEEANNSDINGHQKIHQIDNHKTNDQNKVQNDLLNGDNFENDFTNDLQDNSFQIDQDKKNNSSKRSFKKDQILSLITNQNKDRSLLNDQTIDKNQMKNKIPSKLRNSLNIMNKLFKSSKKINKSNKDRYLLNVYLHDSLMNRSILYKNLKFNDWIYNPLTYSNIKLCQDDLPIKLNEKYLIYHPNLNRAIGYSKDENLENLENVVYNEMKDKNEIEDKFERSDNNDSMNTNKRDKNDLRKNDKIVEIYDKKIDKSNDELENEKDDQLNEKLDNSSDVKVNMKFDDEKSNELNDKTKVIDAFDYEIPNQSNDQVNIQLKTDCEQTKQTSSRWSIIKNFIQSNLIQQNKVHDLPFLK